MSVAFRTQRRIEFADTDMAGIVHFANFFRFMEAAEVEFLRSLGLSVALAWEGEPLGLPRVSASCDYLRPARFEDLIEVAVSLRKLGRKSVTYRFEFSKDNQPIARGEISAVCCRTHGGQRLESVEIPPGIRQKLAPFAEAQD
jgi:YbgC/YbaW family acyl-CoA thioester hydrolase